MCDRSLSGIIEYLYLRIILQLPIPLTYQAVVDDTETDDDDEYNDELFGINNFSNASQEALRK